MCREGTHPGEEKPEGMSRQAFFLRKLMSEFRLRQSTFPIRCSAS